MKITDKRKEEKIILKVGDLVISKPTFGPVITGLVCHEENAEYPYFVLDLSDMEIINGYQELEFILDDFYIYAKKEQLELIIK